VALVGGDEALLEAHRKAAYRGIFELERFVQVEQEKERRRYRETSGSMVAARFEHKTSRKADPHLHSHFVVMNMTRRSDGCWRALKEWEVFGALPLATSVYRAEMARLLAGLGYRVVVRPAGSVGIDGLTKEQLDHFSQRTKEIEAYLSKHGQSGARAVERAALTTREAKAGDLDTSTLMACWQERARNLGIDFRGIRKRLSEERVYRPEVALAVAREAVAFAVTHVSEMRAVFQERELEVAALHHGMGRIVVDDVRAAVGEQKGVIRLRDPRFPCDLLTTKEALHLEIRAIGLMRAGQGLGSAGRGSFRPNRALDPDQERVVRFVLDGRDLVIGLRAREGTRKACALSALREAAEECGWSVRVLSPQEPADNLLPDAGIDNAVAARSGGIDSNPLPRELWIVAGADFLGSKLAVSILERAAQRGAKVVLVGDPRRCHAVEAGNPFAYLRQAGLRTHSLYPSGRQHDPVLREVVARVSEGRIPEAVTILGDRGRILEIANLKDRHRAIVNEVLRAPESVVIVARNDERHELNRLIRQELIATGRVEGGSVTLSVAMSRGLRWTQKGEARSYQVGDRLRFLDRWRRHKIARGSEGRVRAVDLSRNRVAVQTGDGRVLGYDPRRYRAVEVSSVEEHRFAVGDRVQLGALRKPKRASGEFGTIRSLAAGRVHILLDSGRRTTLRLGEGPLALTHGYAILPPHDLGKTVDRVLLSVDTSEPREIVNREHFFFSIVTARRDAIVFTDSRKDLAVALGREAGRTSDVDLIGKRNRERRLRDEGHRSEPGPARHSDDGRRAPGIETDRANGGPRPAVVRGDREPGGPLPHADREGAAARHGPGRAREAPRGAGGAGQAARGPRGSERAASTSPLRAAERVSPPRDGTNRGGGGRRAHPGGDGGGAAVRASAAGWRGLEAGDGPRSEGPGGDNRHPDDASDGGHWVRTLAVGTRHDSAWPSGSPSDQPGKRTRNPSLPALSEVLERVRALERLEEARARRPQPAPTVDRGPERDR
jgi:hypothetical protein